MLSEEEIKQWIADIKLNRDTIEKTYTTFFKHSLDTSYYITLERLSLIISILEKVLNGVEY